MTALLVLVVLGIAIGAGIYVLRQRSERQVESGIVSFRREMRALAPPDQQRSRRRSAPRPDDDRSGEHRGP